MDLRGKKPINNKVVITDMLPREREEYWKDQCPGELDLVFADKAGSDLNELISDASFLICKKKTITRTLLKKAKNLFLVQKFGHWPIGIDLKACRELGIPVRVRPLIVSIAVAEHTMALLLACARDLIRGHKETVVGSYRKMGLNPIFTSERDMCFNWMRLELKMVYKKTLGLIGFGENAREVAIRAQSFGMDIIYYDLKSLDKFWEERLNVKYYEFNDLLRFSDFISLHVPHTKSTEKMIGQSEFLKMKNTAYLINTCRGGVIDEDALIEAIQKKEIAGAALDVFIKEPLQFDHPLIKMENVVLSPHTAGGPTEGLRYEALATMNEIVEILNGKSYSDVSSNYV